MAATDERSVWADTQTESTMGQEDYHIEIHTSNMPGSGTDARISLEVYGVDTTSGQHTLTGNVGAFQNGKVQGVRSTRRVLG